MSVEFFLGANSAAGFYSLYDGFATDKGDRLKLIKGGPGCGKSGFMRKLANKAESRGFAVEYILCSGDPSSLDGVYFPELKLGYADATAPHILEPRFFGFDSCYVNLGAFCRDYDDERIPALTESYRKMYSCAYSYLAAAGSVSAAEIPEIYGKTTVSGVISCARSMANTVEAEPCCEGSRVIKRFIRSIGCTGELVLENTVAELCKQIYLIDDRLGLEDIYFKALLPRLSGRVIVCPSPLLPERIDALLLPDRGIAFAAASLMPKLRPVRRVRLSALVPKEIIARHADELRRRDELASALTAQAVVYLEKAKRYHDELEGCYHDTVCFEALDEFTESELREIFY